MNTSQDSLTEFEGALLSEIRRRGACTAYQVRRAFETSRSFEWSGSTGSVYPAIKRLTGRGLIAAQAAAADGRGTLRLTLSEKGAAALRDWAKDIDRAVGPGFDPFRTRSSEWETLPRTQRRTHLRKLERAVSARIAELEDASAASTERRSTRIELDLALQRSRLAWLRAQDA